MTRATGAAGEDRSADYAVPDEERIVGETPYATREPVPDAERPVPLDIDDPDTGPPVIDDEM